MKRVLLLGVVLAAVAGCASQSSTPSPAYTGSSISGVQSSAAVRDAQQRLRTLGFYNGPVDGVYGTETQLALERYQRARGLDPSGTLNTATVAALREEPRPAPRVAAAPPPPAPLPLDTTNVRATQNRLTQLGFYNGPVDGVWGPSTQVALERFQRSRGLPVDGKLGPATVNALGSDGGGVTQAGLAQPLDPPVVRNIQRRLGQLGFYTGGADGIMGPGTRRAIERFQESRGLAVTGDLNPTTISALGLDPNNLAESASPRAGFGSSARR
jgi:peptidoglycan hydrolase-like protein with peptidoglycan-binding domain